MEINLIKKANKSIYIIIRQSATYVYIAPVYGGKIEVIPMNMIPKLYEYVTRGSLT